MNSSVKAQLRYQVIDRRLRDADAVNHWEDLSAACMQASVDYFGTLPPPSRRTIAYDIQRMRSGVLGYEAPIAFDKHRGYYYNNPRFSIYHVPLTAQLLEECTDALFLLRQLTRNEKLFSLHQSMVVLEERLNLQVDHEKKPLIYFDSSLNAKGQRWLDEVHDRIRKKKAISIRYHAFDKPESHHILSPYFIKEFNNRWYVVGYDPSFGKIINLALDRISDLHTSLQPYQPEFAVDHDTLYRHIYGVTIPDDTTPCLILFRTRPLLSKYLDTKPIHPSQIRTGTEGEYTTYSLEVVVNYELVHKFFSYGADIEIISPVALRETMSAEARKLAEVYQAKK